MGTYSFTHTRGANWNSAFTDALFRTLLTHIRDACTGAGLVQTSDTGQFNLSTVTWPTTSYTDATGYFIFRFNDSLQGTDPIFLRIRAGRGAGNYIPRLSVRIGQGSDGAGNLTGTLGTTMLCGEQNPGYPSADQPVTDYAYHDEGVFWLAYGAVMNAQNIPPTHWFCISRTRDQTTGNFDGQGAIHLGPTGDVTDHSELCYVDWADGVTHSTGYTYHFCMAPLGVTTDDAGNKLAIPHFYNDGGVVKKCWAHWTTASSFLPSGANFFSAAPYGTTRNWLGIGDQNGRAMRGLGQPTAAYAVVLPWS